MQAVLSRVVQNLVQPTNEVEMPKTSSLEKKMQNEEDEKETNKQNVNPQMLLLLERLEMATLLSERKKTIVELQQILHHQHTSLNFSPENMEILLNALVSDPRDTEYIESVLEFLTDLISKPTSDEVNSIKEDEGQEAGYLENSKVLLRDSKPMEIFLSLVEDPSPWIRGPAVLLLKNLQEHQPHMMAGILLACKEGLRRLLAILHDKRDHIRYALLQLLLGLTHAGQEKDIQQFIAFEDGFSLFFQILQQEAAVVFPPVNVEHNEEQSVDHDVSVMIDVFSLISNTLQGNLMTQTLFLEAKSCLQMLPRWLTINPHVWQQTITLGKLKGIYSILQLLYHLLDNADEDVRQVQKKERVLQDMQAQIAHVGDNSDQGVITNGVLFHRILQLACLDLSILPKYDTTFDPGSDLNKQVLIVQHKALEVLHLLCKGNIMNQMLMHNSLVLVSIPTVHSRSSTTSEGDINSNIENSQGISWGVEYAFSIILQYDIDLYSNDQNEQIAAISSAAGRLVQNFLTNLDEEVLNLTMLQYVINAPPVAPLDMVFDAYYHNLFYFNDDEHQEVVPIAPIPAGQILIERFESFLVNGPNLNDQVVVSSKEVRHVTQRMVQLVNRNIKAVGNTSNFCKELALRLVTSDNKDVTIFRLVLKRVAQQIGFQSSETTLVNAKLPNVGNTMHQFQVQVCLFEFLIIWIWQCPAAIRQCLDSVTLLSNLFRILTLSTVGIQLKGLSAIVLMGCLEGMTEQEVKEDDNGPSANQICTRRQLVDLIRGQLSGGMEMLDDTVVELLNSSPFRKAPRIWSHFEEDKILYDQAFTRHVQLIYDTFQQRLLSMFLTTRANPNKSSSSSSLDQSEDLIRMQEKELTNLRAQCLQLSTENKELKLTSAQELRQLKQDYEKQIDQLTNQHLSSQQQQTQSNQQEIRRLTNQIRGLEATCKQLQKELSQVELRHKNEQTAVTAKQKETLDKMTEAMHHIEEKAQEQQSNFDEQKYKYEALESQHCDVLMLLANQEILYRSCREVLEEDKDSAILIERVHELAKQKGALDI